MPLLRIRLFGPPRVEYNGNLLDLDHRKPVALLAYLAVTGQLHTREALATLLWPESPKPLAYLRNNLWILRKSLGNKAESILAVERNVVGLQQGAPIHLDVEEFRGILDGIQSHGRGGSACLPDAPCIICIEQLKQAAGQYTADFMAGFTLRNSPTWDEWHFFQSQQLRRDLGETLSALVAHHREQSDFEAAVSYCQRWLALDPLEEHVQRTLIELYAISEQWAAALRQYQECEEILHTELDVQPAEETQKLYERVRRRELPIRSEVENVPVAVGDSPTLSVVQDPETVTSENTFNHSPANAPLFQLLEQFSPLIGRTGECEEIETILRAPGTHLVTLTGPGGMGKTRLAMQVAANLYADFADGSHFVALASVRSPDFVLPAIAQALNLKDESTVSLEEQLAKHLTDREILLVLDNFEQVIEAAPFVERMIRPDSKSKILVTSREVLQLRCEQEFVVPSFTPARCA